MIYVRHPQLHFLLIEYAWLCTQVAGAGLMGIGAPNGFLVDECGEVWPVQSPHLMARLKTRRMGPDLCWFAIRNLGYIYVEFRADRVVAASYLESSVSAVALTGLVIWLHGHQNCAVVIFSDTGQSTGRLFHTREQVTEYIGRTIESLPEPDVGFRSEPLSIGASVFDTRWRVAREILTAEIEHLQRSSLLDALFSGFYSLSSRCGSSGDYCVSEVGGAVKVQFPSQFKGDTFRRMYDENYGRWIADTMREVRPDNSAITQTISAPIMWPGSQQPIVHKYTRLVVGFEAESRQYLLTATQVHSKTERRLAQVMR